VKAKLFGDRRMEQVVASGYAAANGLKDRFLLSPQQSWLCYNTTRILSKNRLREVKACRKGDLDTKAVAVSQSAARALADASEITGLPRDNFEVHEISRAEFEGLCSQ
jgi:hypothetical protein